MALPTIRAFVANFGSDVGLIVGNDLPTELLALFNHIQVEIVVISRTEGRRRIQHGNPIGGCDIFVSLVQWHNDSVIHFAREADAKLTIGHYEGFDLFLPLHNHLHCIDQTFRLFAPFAPREKCEKFSGPIQFEAGLMDRFRSLRTCFKGKPLLVAHFDSAKNKIPSRDWINSVLNAVDQRVECSIVAIGRTSMLEAFTNVDVEILDSLGLCMLLAASADVFIGVDSCMLHVADLHRRTGIGVFVSTDPKEYGFRFATRARSITTGSKNDDSSRILTSDFLCEQLQLLISN